MSAIAADFIHSLQDRYRVERELGQGGMATVHLAHDLRHDRPVALKVLAPELAAGLGAERFLREIRLAARLQHPHILPVFDSGETAGLLWYTMPYVEGETLRARLAREVQLSVPEAVRLARQVAEALDYAHRRGVVHRDVKPANILLSDGEALLADFGIARLPAAAEGERLTRTGTSLGTPAYMSPEQASGDAHVDGRSDVYGLGCVLYEMLVGEPPFTGPTPQILLARRTAGPAPSASRSRPTIPPAVDAALARALERVPADRFATAGAFARALEDATAPVTAPVTAPGPAPSRAGRGAGTRRRTALLLSVAAAAGLAAAATLLWTRAGGDRPPATPRLMAVLPFENLGRPEDDYFADGMTDAVRGKLATLPGVQVIARASSVQYRHSAKRPEQIARELGVRYLLTGTVRWARDSAGANRVEVSPELVDVGGRAPTTRWQAPFDAVLSDVFQVQASIAGRVGEALGVALGAVERRQLAEAPTRNLAAYDAFLRAEAAADNIGTIEPTALRRAAALYRRAVALDSTFVQGWVQLSRTYSQIAGFAGPADAATTDGARRAAFRALALAPDRPEPPLALGSYYADVAHDFTRAGEQFARVRRLAPENVPALVGMALVEERLGRWTEALAHLRLARTLDPRSVPTAVRLAEALLFLRRTGEAAAASDSVLALAPNNVEAIEDKAAQQLQRGDLAGARAVVRDAIERGGLDAGAMVAYLATWNDLYWLLDDRQQQLLLQLPVTAFSSRNVWAQCLAQVWAERGDSARARAYADSSLMEFDREQIYTLQNAQEHALHGVQLAYRGRGAEAIREGETAVRLLPIERDGYQGAYVLHQLARIYVLAGEPEKAIDGLERLLAVPYLLTPGWLRIDPGFAPLREHPRFRGLVAAPSL